MAAKVVAFDLSSPMYAACYKHAEEIARGERTSAPLLDVLALFRPLLGAGCLVVVVADGSLRPAEKARCRAEREEKRERAREALEGKLARGARPAAADWSRAMTLPAWLQPEIAR